MITFLPSPDFEATARILDDKRLGAQRYEAWSILKWLRNPGDYPQLVRAGYCRMWRGYEAALVRYTNAMLREWARRGKNNKELRPEDPGRGLEEFGDIDDVEMPPWMGCDELHSYHRGALMHKLPEHYGKLGWAETGNEYNGSYPWPICLDEGDGSIGGVIGSWILRWPKSVGLDPVPIMQTGNGSVQNLSRGGSGEARSLRKDRSFITNNGSRTRPMKAAAAMKQRTTKHKSNKTDGKTAKKANEQPLRRSLRLSKLGKKVLR